MKKLLQALCLLAALGASAHAAEWLYIDVIPCGQLVYEAPPDPIKWSTLVVEISVWDEANPGGMVHDIFNPSLGGSLYFSDHYLPGTIAVWNAWISPGKQRVDGYDGQWYQVRWQDAAAYDNSISNYSYMHLDFQWRVDPDQSLMPDENTPIRQFQWQERW